MSYQVFAQVYDAIMDETLYDRWAHYVAQTMPHSQSSILELACGTGALAVHLKKQGLQVTGLDLSENMLTLAQDRALAAGVELPLIEGDMLDLTEIGTFDMVTCFSDSLCYMPDETAIKKVFEQVFQVLNQEGVFVFDVHSLYQMDQIFPGYMFNDNQEDIAFMWQSYAGEVPHSVEHELTFFVYEPETASYQRYDELHKERTYELTVYQQLLKEAGFQSVTCTAEFGQEAMQETSTRWFFECKK
ncbi:class I SAM-dependent DNA methyltransferase [Isobaculum melis]|uniref:Methyltransferase domain-containing protein n=1 Tax=Isobaculum melis TaxID=142588 RepID=A0A1H9T936_9LACT|nr:class I SAM-dependent methyltransferase [Isobaculum melis]SER93143.1 Methyltransferase domain-containing protein [Isobaculum melis]